ncbi:MAG: ankyrin repeat domain-containing protein [Firmicutes bacterium]|nr:ankyrin repeat domain-containing protein [Bacillota bacterium]
MRRKLSLLLVLFLLCLVISVRPVLAADQNTALLAAVQQGDEAAVTSLLAQGADLEATDELGRTALLIAVEQGQLDLVRSLLQAGAKINVKTKDGESPFLLAARHNQPQILQLLFEQSVDGKDYLSALYLAAKYNYPEVVKVLGEQIDLYYFVENVLCLAAKYGSNEVINLLLTAGIKININSPGIDIESEEKSALKWGPLFYAVAYDQLETAELLLTKGKAQTHYDDIHKRSVLMLACEKGNAPMVALLLDHGASLNAWDEEGWTPLMYAAKNGRVEVIKLMLERNPKLNLNRTNNKKETALDIANAHHQTAVVELLKAAGAK